MAIKNLTSKPDKVEFALHGPKQVKPLTTIELKFEAFLVKQLITQAKKMFTKFSNLVEKEQTTYSPTVYIPRGTQIIVSLSINHCTCMNEGQDGQVRMGKSYSIDAREQFFSTHTTVFAICCARRSWSSTRAAERCG